METSELPKDFGARLRWFRTQRNLTQSDSGKAVSRSTPSISDWENGVSEPSLDQVQKIAELLGTSAARLAFGEDHDPVVAEEQASFLENQYYRKSGNSEAPPRGHLQPQLPKMLDPRFLPRTEPTPQMCLEYFAEYLSRAQHEPGGVGYVWVKLQRQFPLEKFRGAASASAGNPPQK